MLTLAEEGPDQVLLFFEKIKVGPLFQLSYEYDPTDVLKMPETPGKIKRMKKIREKS